VNDGIERLWAPYRMAYIRGVDEAAARNDGCPLCTIPSTHDDESLVVARGEHVYTVLNLHPYNPGHLMTLPYRHIGELDELNDDEFAELHSMTRDAVRAIKATSSPHGFNVGFNLGGVAGGSLSAHIHQHVVPRWNGDANFMTIIGNTKVMAQLLIETRDLLRATWPRPQ
jgi:ATP adenylyltransferase